MLVVKLKTFNATTERDKRQLSLYEATNYKEGKGYWYKRTKL